MNDRVVLITGATSGIGYETAKALSALGARVVLTARDREKGETVKSGIETLTGNEVTVIKCDLASQHSVKNCCNEFRGSFDKLDLLINNAGVWNTTFKESSDGIVETFAVNVLAPYLMLQHCADLLTAAPSPHVITVSSGLHFGRINFDDIEYRQKFSGFHAYRQSKLAVILFTRLLASLKDYEGIRINCMHPGMVNTQLGRNGSFFFNAMFKLFGKSSEKGADTLVYMATSPEVEKINGEYFVNRKVKRTTPQSYDMQAAERLLKIMNEKSII